MKIDQVYAVPREKIGDFVFDQRVVDVFPDMIQRSVPGYQSVVAMTVELAAQYARPNTSVYDLGSSLGAVTLPMSARLAPSTRIVAIDSSAAMVTQLRKQIASGAGPVPIEVREADLRELDFQATSFAVLNFTLQFVPIEERFPLLKRLCDSMIPGGAIVLSEKIALEDPAEQALLTSLHHAFKRANGYSELEIAQKRNALENTLIPETLETHVNRLRTSGFDCVTVWFRCLNFASMLAIKAE